MRDEDHGSDTRRFHALIAWLTLVRVPNLFTVPGDVIVGAYMAGAPGRMPAATLYALIVASICLYAAGVLLNDYVDVAIDRAQRPDRPIVSGVISRNAALTVAIFLLLLAMGFAATTGIYAAFIAGLIAFFVVFYNVGARRVPVVGFAVMGICRGLNVIMGSAAAESAPAVSISTYVAAGVIAVYIFFVSALAAKETDGVPGVMLRLSPPLALAAGMTVLTLTTGVSLVGLIAVAVAVIAAAGMVIRIPRGKTPARIGMLIRHLIVIQAVILILATGTWTLPAMSVAALFPFSVLMGYWFYGS